MGIILLYHRVADLEFDPQLLAVSKENFKKQITYLKSNYNIVSLKDIINTEKDWLGGKKNIAITFDDGYSDNLINAKPLLEEFSAFATFFITVNNAIGQKPFWWDRLASITFADKELPKRLNIKISKNEYNWHNKNSFFLSRVMRKEWNVLKNIDLNNREKLYLDLHSILKKEPQKEIDRVLYNLLEWSESKEKINKRDMPLDRNSIKRIADSRLIEIGSHGLNHTSLNCVPAESQNKEVLESKKFLEEIIQVPIESFSYCFGGVNDIPNRVKDFLKESGYKRACANFKSIAGCTTDPFMLPRFIVRNWNLTDFKKNLKGFLEYKN
ncbi:MAG: polysaccharide deacetylase family protein [Candidatus Omnitrophota bacterium]